MDRVVQRSTCVTLLTCVVLLLFGSSLLQRYLGHVMETPNLDFLDYYFEAAAVHDHPRAPMYTPALEGNPQLRWSPPTSEVYQRAEAAGFHGTQLYLYPPLLADLLVPTVRLGPQKAAALWRLGNLFIVLLSVAALARFARLRIRSFETGLMLCCAYAFWPVHETVAQGQVSIVLLGLWTVGVICYARGRLVLSAVAFALAAWLKVSPVLLLPVVLLWRDWRWVRAYLLAGFAAGLLMVRYNGWSNLLASAQVLRNMGGSVPAIGNKCISAMLWWFRLGHPATSDQARALINGPQPAVFSVACKLLSVTYLLGCLYLVWYQRKSASQVDRAMVLAVFATVLPLVSPVSWRHGYAASLPLLLLLWIAVLRSPASRVTRVVLLALTTVAVGSLCFDLVAQSHLPGIVSVLLSAVWPVSCMLLCVDVLWRPPLSHLFAPQGEPAALPA